MLLDSTKLRKLRNLKKVSQFDLADAIELSQSTLAKYEKNNSAIKFNTLVRLCNFFDVEPSELLVDGQNFTLPIAQEKKLKPVLDIESQNISSKKKPNENTIKDYETEKLNLINRLITILEKLLLKE